MGRFWRNLAAALLVATLIAGCGGSRSTGKNSNQDKPKSADASG
jgi:hypothetical protein